MIENMTKFLFLVERKCIKNERVLGQSLLHNTSFSDLKDNQISAKIQNQPFQKKKKKKQNQRFDWLPILPTISTFVNFAVIMPNKHLVKLGNQQHVIKLFTTTLCLISLSFWFIWFYVAVKVEPYENGGGGAMEEREACSGWERESKEKNIPIFGSRDRYEIL